MRKVDNPEEYKKTLLAYLDTYKYDLDNLNSMSEPERDILISAVRTLCAYVEVSEDKEMDWLIKSLQDTWTAAGAKEQLRTHDKIFYAYTSAQLIKRGSSKRQAMKVLQQLYYDKPIAFESFYAARVRELKDYEKDISSSMKNDEFLEYVNATARLFGSVKCNRLDGHEQSFNRTVDMLREWIRKFVDVYRSEFMDLEKGNYDLEVKQKLDKLFSSDNVDPLDYIYHFKDPQMAVRVHNCISTLLAEKINRKEFLPKLL